MKKDYKRKQAPHRRRDGNYIETRDGVLKWCEVLSTEAWKQCTLEFCSSPHRQFGQETRRNKRRRRPHSFPRLWWDASKGQPVPYADRVAIPGRS